MTSEFALIDRHFKRHDRHTLLGIGDDGALLQPRPGHELVVSTDMLVAGTHFYADADPADIGWKTLAVNLSDLAAMGAEPRWAFLALALPKADDPWVAEFARGLFECASQHGVDLAGGDTTRGPMNFCVTVIGEVPNGMALRRSGAQPGDDIWISGCPGLAALGLAHLQGRCTLPGDIRSECLAALHRPQPRVALGSSLRGIAHAAIDVSDGLLADLGHLLTASSCAAELHDPLLPMPNAMEAVDPQLMRDCLLAGGDDFELLFVAPAAARSEISSISRSHRLALTRIGSCTRSSQSTPRLLDQQGMEIPVVRRGYDHFSG